MFEFEYAVVMINEHTSTPVYERRMAKLDCLVFDVAIDAMNEIRERLESDGRVLAVNPLVLRKVVSNG